MYIPGRLIEVWSRGQEAGTREGGRRLPHSTFSHVHALRWTEVRTNLSKMQCICYNKKYLTIITTRKLTGGVKPNGFEATDVTPPRYSRPFTGHITRIYGRRCEVILVTECRGRK
jgi:hypothetical protein